jgi:ABC-type Fe3+ transport system substrate-binding protein
MFKKIFFYLAVSWVLQSCSTEVAKPLPHQHIVLASDFLTKKDLPVFKQFTKKFGIKIYIISLSEQQLIEKLNKEKTATRIDAILLSSLVGMEKANRLNALQMTLKNPIVAIGFDPYIYTIVNDSLNIKASYRGVFASDNWSSLSTKTNYFTPMLAEVKELLRKKKSDFPTWFKQFFKHKYNQDTAVNNSAVISKYSDFMALDYSTRKKITLLFPNEITYTDLATFAIVKQARNYSNALLLRRAIQQEKMNRIIAAKGDFFPLESATKSRFAYQNRTINWAVKNPLLTLKNFTSIAQLLQKEEKK